MRVISKALIAIEAILRGMRYKTKPVTGKRVMIALHQAFGDAIIASDSLKEYAKIFPKEQGYEVKYLARPSVVEFLKSVVPYASELNFEAVDFKRYIEDYAYYRETTKQYKNSTDILIVPVSTPGAEIFSCSMNASRKIASIRAVDVNTSVIMRLLNKYAYTEKIRPNKNEMALQRHRQLIHYLGDTEFKARLPRLKHEPRIIPEEKYCVVSAGASMPERWWPVERFAKIVDYVNEELDMNVHICGGKDEIEISERLKSLVKSPERTINHAGKTSFTEWSAIIEHASLFIGNDTGTSHLAAAHRVRSVCIIGDYEFIIFPYKVDVLEDGDRLPLCVWERMPCENCRERGYYSGSGNPECQKRLRAGKCALCIEAISVEDVKSAIQEIMKEGKK